MNTTAATGFDGNREDPPSIIGSSLLPFLPSARSNGNVTRKYNNIGDASLPENGVQDFHNASPKRTRLSPGASRDPYNDEESADHSQGNEYPSLLLRGGISTFFQKDYERRNPLQEENSRHHRRRPSRKHILLRGPPGSGKTSLAMNLAYAEAKKDSCLPSNCLSAIVYQPVLGKGKSQGNNGHTDNLHSGGECDRFPLFCRPLPLQSACTSAKNAANPESSVNEASVNEAIETENQEEEDSWDPDTLRRIRICRVSSVRELWMDLLLLAGKPADEQPTRVIVIEDLDEIIESGGDPLTRNQISGRDRKNTKHNHNIAAMLKSVAIAADTTRNVGNQHPTRTNSLILLVSLTMSDSRKRQRDAPGSSSNNNRNGCFPNGSSDASDILAVASCIDTVVSLYETPQKLAEVHNVIEEDRNLVWKIPVNARKSDATGKKRDTSGNSDNEVETTVIDSLWQAEIQERNSDLHCRDGGGDSNGDTNGILLVDYAFVESFPTEEDNKFGRIGGECEGSNKELRWKHSSS